MIPGGPLYGFCIGNGYTGGEWPEIWSRNVQKLKENDRFCMNEVFRGAFGSKLGPGGKKYAGDDPEVRFKPKPCFRGVLKDSFFNPDFFAYFWLPIKIETPIWSPR